MKKKVIKKFSKVKHIKKRRAGVHDEEFIKNLWKYVLYGYSLNRCLPQCKYCKKNEFDFKYIGLGGIKQVGRGEMFVVSEDCKTIYKLPDIVFHYFYKHGFVPSKKFKNAVINGPKPETLEYIESVSKYYKARFENYNNNVGTICKKCGKKSRFVMAYEIDKTYDGMERSILLYKDEYDDMIEEEYRWICTSCLHYVDYK